MKKMNSSRSLPDELMTMEILPRLPIKSLLRFRSVSKEWLGMVSSPSLKKVRGRNPNQFVLLCYFPSCFMVIDPADGKLLCEFNLTRFPEPDERYFHHSGSCHGLVFFSDDIACNVYVCNPSTRESTKLPMSPFAQSRKPEEVRIGMVFLSESNTYKIVVWFIDDVDLVSCFEVFTLTDGGGGGGEPFSSSWTSMERNHNLEYKPGQVLRQCVSVDGVMYWQIEADEKNFRKMHTMPVLAFDVRTEEWTIIQPPIQCPLVYKPFKFWSTCLVELRGSLCIVFTSLWSGYSFLDPNPDNSIIWKLRDKEWIQECQTSEPVDNLLTSVPARRDLHDDSQEEVHFDLLFMIPRYYRPHLLCYNSKSLSVTTRFKPPWPRHVWYRAFVYSETMFSLNP